MNIEEEHYMVPVSHLLTMMSFVSIISRHPLFVCVLFWEIFSCFLG